MIAVDLAIQLELVRSVLVMREPVVSIFHADAMVNPFAGRWCEHQTGNTRAVGLKCEHQEV